MSGATRAAVLALAALSVSCQGGVEAGAIRDVRPRTVEIEEKITIETSVPLRANATTEVRLEGLFEVVGGERRERVVVLKNARATSPAGRPEAFRVLADIDPIVEEQVGGHARFFGTITIVQEGKPVATGEDQELDFFPPTARKLAYTLVGGKEAKELADWLGLRLRQVELEGGGTALRVVSVRQAFNTAQFMAAADCGIWNEETKSCRAPLDARVHKGEALAAGFDEELFAEIDENGDGYVERLEAHHFDRGPSPAAAAGIRKGDLLLEAGGRRLSAPNDLPVAWKGDGATVAVKLLRGGETLEVSLPRYGKPASLPQGFLLAGILFAIGLLVILPVPLIGGLIVVWERKIAGRMQSRPGPNRVGPQGWLQWLADGLKLIVKEDVIPADADPYLFRASPYLVFIGVFSTFVVIPFSQIAIVADLNIGILYLLSVTSIVVVGIIMGGWASNSKWSLLGGMRSAAQIISYELPASIAILSVVTLAGTLSTQGIVHNQGGSPWNWHVFDNPFTFACFFVYFISALAEGNRTPFDLPEAESELVAGYNTEYSGFRFSIFFLAEWVNLAVIGAVATTVFLGGWRIPGVSPAQVEASLALQLASAFVFLAKVVTLVFVIIWIRWTLPRFRVDQMMNMCWKYFLPISLVSFVAVTGWVWLVPPIVRQIVRFAMFGVFGIGIFGYFVARVNYTRKTTRVLELRGA